MKCPYCGCTEEIVGDNQKRNLQAYKQGGGSVRVATQCCHKPVLLIMVSHFHVAQIEANGDADDWGVPYAK